MQKRMNRSLITTKELKNEEEKSSWKRFVKCPGVLMAKKPEDQYYTVYGSQ